MAHHNLQLVEQHIEENAYRILALLDIFEGVGNLLGSSNNGYKIYRVGHFHLDHLCKVLKFYKIIISHFLLSTSEKY